jgi:hypothetical protein
MEQSSAHREEKMANFASELKSEISRIARKEIRAETQALKKASAQYRTDIAALKRRIAEQDRLIARLRKGKSTVETSKTPEEGPQLRFRADGFACRRNHNRALVGSITVPEMTLTMLPQQLSNPLL